MPRLQVPLASVAVAVAIEAIRVVPGHLDCHTDIRTVQESHSGQAWFVTRVVRYDGEQVRSAMNISGLLHLRCLH